MLTIFYGHIKTNFSVGYVATGHVVDGMYGTAGGTHSLSYIYMSSNRVACLLPAWNTSSYPRSHVECLLPACNACLLPSYLHAIHASCLYEIHASYPCYMSPTCMQSLSLLLMLHGSCLHKIHASYPCCMSPTGMKYMPLFYVACLFTCMQSISLANVACLLPACNPCFLPMWHVSYLHAIHASLTPVAYLWFAWNPCLLPACNPCRLPTHVGNEMPDWRPDYKWIARFAAFVLLWIRRLINDVAIIVHLTYWIMKAMLRVSYPCCMSLRVSSSDHTF